MPTEAPSATPSSPRPASLDEEQQLIAATPLARDQAALAEAFFKTGPLPRAARTEPLQVQVGDVETFWVLDAISSQHYQVEAALRYAGPHLLMYVDTALSVDQDAVERAARVFEQEIYPRNRALFGEEESPGIDGDARLTVLNTVVRGAGGYFSSTDGVVRAANRFSNERDMFVIDNLSFPVGGDGYAMTLAHELQHMIHDAAQPRGAAWFDEGMSSLAEDLNGFITQGATAIYLAAPDLPLTDWRPVSAHYGLSQLFMRYVHEHYAGDAGLRELIRAGAGTDLDVFARLASRARPDIRDFADLYGDWATANLLNDPQVGDGRYAYRLLPRTVAAEPARRGEVSATVSQFGADYLALEGPLTLRFDGAEEVSLTGAQPAEGRRAWWSGRGDESVATLTRGFDLRGVERATLRFSVWHELELGYDYAFISASADGGATWDTLRGLTTSDLDPHGHNFGQGLTGVSGAPGADIDDGTRARWVEEQIDLTPYAGREILLRFWTIGDAAVSGAGLMLDAVRIPEIGFADGAEDGAGQAGGWEAQGFSVIDGSLAQRWELRLVRFGEQTTVEPVPLDEQERATIQLGAGERAALVVIGATRFTTEPAEYRYVVE